MQGRYSIKMLRLRYTQWCSCMLMHSMSMLCHNACYWQYCSSLALLWSRPNLQQNFQQHVDKQQQQQQRRWRNQHMLQQQLAHMSSQKALKYLIIVIVAVGGMSSHSPQSFEMSEATDSCRELSSSSKPKNLCTIRKRADIDIICLAHRLLGTQYCMHVGNADIPHTTVAFKTTWHIAQSRAQRLRYPFVGTHLLRNLIKQCKIL